MARGPLYVAIRSAYRLVRYRIGPAIGHEIMRRKSPSQMVSQWPEGTIPLGPKVCVFVHWDGAGEVRDHVMHYLRSLAAAGVSVVFVTNSGMLRPAAMEALQRTCAGVIVRRNVGYDFGAWAEGIQALGLPRPDTSLVAIANDSVYGPIRPLDELFGRIDFTQADVWGCTESWQSRYHLQSYFMAFSPAVVASPAWTSYWSQVRPTWSKTWLIKLYEIGLTQSMLKAGFRCRALWPYRPLTQDMDLQLLRKDDDEAAGLQEDPIVQVRRLHVLRLRGAISGRIPLNPTSDLWRQLLNAGFPFVKRELLRDNPTHVSDLVEWRDVAAGVATHSMAPIERDLQRIAKDRVP